ncbi:hypothetical protein ACOSP7_002519 [Xanthoceras sorbifolium]
MRNCHSRMMMVQLRRTTREFDIESVGTNTFVFHFKCEGDGKRVLEGGPWYFNKNLLVLREIQGVSKISEMYFGFVPLWIKFYNLPIACMTREMGFLLAGMVGKVVDMDFGPNGVCLGRFLRVRESGSGKAGEDAGLHRCGSNNPIIVPVLEVNNDVNLLQSERVCVEVLGFDQSEKLKGAQAVPKANSFCAKVQDIPKATQSVLIEESHFAKDPMHQGVVGEVSSPKVKKWKRLARDKIRGKCLEGKLAELGKRDSDVMMEDVQDKKRGRSDGEQSDLTASAVAVSSIFKAFKSKDGGLRWNSRFHFEKAWVEEPDCREIVEVA